ncbi:hypothetical protein N9869_02020 [Algibacter sp.]|jgi:hypothetical protein|nr:hypothetical protein [Algibacter sp.]MDB4274079.1 hypothetical protein [Algibacter sp.]|tara:strand:+ start:114 stop:746 length:633 start_codon:yes stop_codon:yes gene_type:complete
MNYTSLKANVEEICEQTFTADQHALFTQQAEQKIFNYVDLPAMRTSDDGPLVATNKLYTLPTDHLYTYSISVITSSTSTFLLNKDVNFIREAYPVNTSAKYGLPKFYAQFSETQIELAPTPDQNYEIEHVYARYPTSIVTAGSSFLGTNYDTALLNGTLLEAIRFQKGEADMIALYDKHYLQAITLLKQAGDGKLRQDMYRSGQTKTAVS